MSIGAWFTGTWHGQNVAPACRSFFITIVVKMIIIVRLSKPAEEIRSQGKTTGMTIETTRLLFHTYLDKVILLPEMVWLCFLGPF